MNVRFLGCLVALATAILPAIAAEVPTGKVLEKIACVADNAQTYALYIPSSFDPAKKWPVLFCFDPEARGKAPVERFQAAAEKFGWVVAGSNNSRNGPWEANATAINAMVNDVCKHLPIDAKRVYLAGLSGGARVACQVAFGGFARGVIACSASFPGPDVPSPLPFVFFGTAGVTDFNYGEMRRTDRELDDRKAVHRVMIFPGGHEWLPAGLAVEALAWMELQAMRDGTRAADAAWIQAQYEARLAAIPAQPAAENLRALKSLAADFKGLADTAAVEKKVTALAGSAEIREWEKTERANERREQALLNELMTAAMEGFPGSVKNRIAELRTKAAAPEDSEERRLAQRVLQGAASGCGEVAREAMRQQEYQDAAKVLEMATQLRPERPQSWFELARARASLRDKKAAVAALQQAVAAGFKDAARVRGEKAFDFMRSDAAFVAVVEGMK